MYKICTNCIFFGNNFFLNREIIFQAENETDKEEWMSVLLNLKDRCLNQAFQDNGQSSNGGNQGLLEFQRTLVNFIRSLPGNDHCCDCGSQNGKKYLKYT